MDRRTGRTRAVDHLAAGTFGFAAATMVITLIWQVAPYAHLSFGDAEDRPPLLLIWVCVGAMGVIGYRVFIRHVRLGAYLEERTRRPERELPTPLAREFLAGRDVACPGCGYNLRDLDGQGCPECNRPVVLVVTPDAHPVIAPAAGLWASVVVTMGASAAGAWIAGACVWERYRRGDFRVHFVCMVAMLVVSLVVLGVLAQRAVAWWKGGAMDRDRWRATTQAALLMLSAMWMVSAALMFWAVAKRLW